MVPPIIHVDGRKCCSQCLQWYPATPEYFNRRRRSSDGLRSECRRCQKAEGQRYYADNIDVRREAIRRYTVENAAKERARKQRWQTENREQQREANRRWQRENPDKSASKKRNRDARLRAAHGQHTASDVAAQFRRQKGRCYYCDCKMTARRNQPNTRTVDHVVPIARGGSNGPENIVIACAACNFSKQDKLPHEWGRGGKLI